MFYESLIAVESVYRDLARVHHILKYRGGPQGWVGGFDSHFRALAMASLWKEIHDRGLIIDYNLDDLLPLDKVPEDLRGEVYTKLERILNTGCIRYLGLHKNTTLRTLVSSADLINPAAHQLLYIIKLSKHTFTVIFNKSGVGRIPESLLTFIRNLKEGELHPVHLEVSWIHDNNIRIIGALDCANITSAIRVEDEELRFFAPYHHEPQTIMDVTSEDGYLYIDIDETKIPTD